MAACFLYVLITIVYLSPIADYIIVFGDKKYNNMVWGGIYLIANMGLISFLCHLAEYKQKGNELLALQYLKFLCLANCAYIIYCIFREKYVVIYQTGVFAYVMGLGFLSFLVHCAIRKP